MPAEEMQVRVDRRTVTRIPAWTVIVIVVLHLFWRATDALDLPGEVVWRRLSNVDVETTFPTWLSMVLFVANAVLAWLLGRDEKLRAGRYVRHWYFLAVVLVALSVDEIAAIHEAVTPRLRGLLGLSGVFYYAWVIPALVLVALLGLVFVRFVFDMPRHIRNRVLVAGISFVAAAVGLEMVAGTFAGTESREGLAYFLIATVEEVVELGALILLVDTFVLHLSERRPAIRLSFEP